MADAVTVQISEVAFGPNRHSGLEPESREARPNPAYAVHSFLDTGFRRYDDIEGQLVSPDSEQLRTQGNRVLI